MQQEERNRLSDYLGSIANATAEQKMRWSEANPSTYVYSTTTPVSGKIVLQKVDPTLYVLEALASGDQSKIIVSSQIDPQIHTKLREIFSTIQKLQDIRGLNFLGSILPNDK